MRKGKFLLLASIVAVSSVFVSSCTKDDTPPEIVVKATYGTKGQHEISDGDIIEDAEGTVVTFAITFNMGGDKLDSVSIGYKFDSKEYSVLDTCLSTGWLNSGAKSFSIGFQTAITDPEKEITFAAVDGNGNRTPFKVTLKVPTAQKPAAGEYVTSGEVMLGAQSNATLGSSYSVALRQIFKLSDAKANSGSIDWVYYHSNNSANIAAPSNTTLPSIFTTASGMNSWTTKNATKFTKVASGFATSPTAANLDEKWTSVTDASFADDAATSLNAGDLVAFKMVNNKIGAFVVTGVGGTNAGTISFKIIEKK